MEKDPWEWISQKRYCIHETEVGLLSGSTWAHPEGCQHHSCSPEREYLWQHILNAQNSDSDSTSKCVPVEGILDRLDFRPGHGVFVYGNLKCQKVSQLRWGVQTKMELRQYEGSREKDKPTKAHSVNIWWMNEWMDGWKWLNTTLILPFKTNPRWSASWVQEGCPPCCRFFRLLAWLFEQHRTSNSK